MLLLFGLQTASIKTTQVLMLRKKNKFYHLADLKKENLVSFQMHFILSIIMWLESKSYVCVSDIGGQGKYCAFIITKMQHYLEKNRWFQQNMVQPVYYTPVHTQQNSCKPSIIVILILYHNLVIIR